MGKQEINVEGKNTFGSQLLDLIKKIEKPPYIALEEGRVFIESLHYALKTSDVEFDTITMFGSRVSNLCMDGSDIDLYISPSGKINATELENAIRRSDQFTKLYHITSRVPVMHFMSSSSEIFCDLSYTTSLGYYKTELTKAYLRMDSRLRPCILFLKHYMKTHRLNGPGKFISHVITWLMIFYMQVAYPKQIPTVQFLHRKSCKTSIIENWECILPDDISVYDNPNDIVPQDDDLSSFHNILLGFFKYYSSFDFTNNIISPYLGKAIPVTSFKDENFLSLMFPKYFENIGLNRVVPFKDSLVNVQDPLEHSHNISFPIRIHIYNIFKFCCTNFVTCSSDSTEHTLRNVLDVEMVPKSLRKPKKNKDKAL